MTSRKSLYGDSGRRDALLGATVLAVSLLASVSSAAEVAVNDGAPIQTAPDAVPPAGASSTTEAATAIAPAPSAGATAVQEVVVTGSYLSHAAQSGSSVRVLSADKIEPRATIGELFLDSPEFSGNAVLSDASANSQTGASFINLRGLGPEATLILLNGRRQAVNAQPDNKGNFGVDSEALTPQIMLNRVEIVKDGASAIYGTDAVAGVVNFITRTNFTGAEFDTNWDRTEVGGENTWTVGGIIGGGDDQTHFVLGGEWVKRDPLNYRDYSQVVNYTNQPGVLTLSPFGIPGTYRLIAGQTYNSTVPAGSPTRTIADPLCGNPILGPGQVPGVLETSGVNQTCGSNSQLGRSIVGGEDRVTLLATGYHRVSEYFNIQGEAGFTRKDLSRDGAYGLNVSFAPIVPASNPGNPFGGPVTFSGRVPGAPSNNPLPSITNDIDYHAAVNFNGKLPIPVLEAKGWNWDGELNYSGDTSDAFQNDTVKVDLQNALNGLGGPACNPATGKPGVGNCFYYNPFGNAFLAAPGSPQANSAALLKWLLPAQDRASAASLATWHLIVRGDLFNLPAGPVGLAFGYEGRRETLNVNVDPTTIDGGWSFITQESPFSASRVYQAGFFETRIPVLTTLEIQGAGRYEEFNGIGSFNPKVGVNYAPFQWLTVRGSYGQSFQAPNLQTVYGVGSSSASGINIPGINALSAKAITDPTPSLKPETSTSYTAGLDLKPIHGLTLSADFYEIDFTNLIVQQSPQLLLQQYEATGANASQLIFDQSGTILLDVYLHNINAASVTTNGFDLGANYVYPTDRFGRFSFNGAATYVNKYDYQEAVGGAVINGVGSSNQGLSIPSVPQWKADLTFSWELGPQRALAAVHYVSGLSNPALASNSPLQDRADYTTVDALYAYTFKIPHLGGPATIRVGIENLFDTLPPLQAAQQFYPVFPGVYDPRGRRFSLDLKKSF